MKLLSPVCYIYLCATRFCRNFEGFSLECNPGKGIKSRVYNFEGFSLKCNPGKGIKSGGV